MLKRLFTLALFLGLAIPLYAQGNTTTIPSSGPPSSTACNFNLFVNDTKNGNIYYCDAGTLTILNGGGGSGAIVPLSNLTTTGIVVNSGCSGSNNCYFAYVDTKYITDASWTPSNPVAVTCSNSDCSFVSADTGKACFWLPGATTEGTFTYVSAQAGTCSGGTGSTVTANGTFAWGHDDTTNLDNARTAELALPNCGPLYLPPGNMMINAGVGNSNVPTNCLKGSAYTGEFTMPSVIGSGGAEFQSTTLIPAPGFNFSTCYVNGCFFEAENANGGSFRDLLVNGLNQSLSGISTSPATSLWWMGYGQNVGGLGWGTAASNAPNGIYVEGQNAKLADIAVQDFGTACGVNASGTGILLSDVYAMNGGTTGAQAALCVSTGGSIVTSISSGYGPALGGNKFAVYLRGAATLTEIGDYIEQSAAGTYNIAINTPGAVLNLDGVQFCNGGNCNVTTTGLYASTGGVTINATNTKFAGGSSAQWLYAQGATTVFNDLGGNTFAGPISLLGIWHGSGSIGGVNQTNGNVSVTSGAGWGTGATVAVDAIPGSSQLESFTITIGATPSATATATVTFPMEFQAIPKCQLPQQLGGNQVLTSLTLGTVTATTAQIVASGTLVGGNTIDVQLGCFNP